MKFEIIYPICSPEHDSAYNRRILLSVDSGKQRDVLHNCTGMYCSRDLSRVTLHQLHLSGPAIFY